MEILKQLLYSDAGSELSNWALLIFRIMLATELFWVHGMKKFRLENGQKEQVPNPFNLPDKLNRIVATSSDTILPFFVIFGIGTRIVVLPIISVTAIGYFVVHRKDDREVRDVPYMYTLSFLLLLFLGAGTYSIDHYLLNVINGK